MDFPFFSLRGNVVAMPRPNPRDPAANGRKNSFSPEMGIVHYGAHLAQIKVADGDSAGLRPVVVMEVAPLYTGDGFSALAGQGSGRGCCVPSCRPDS